MGELRITAVIPRNEQEPPSFERSASLTGYVYRCIFSFKCPVFIDRKTN